MAHPELKNRTKIRIRAIQDALDSGTLNQVRRLLSSLPPPEAAHLLESSPPKLRATLWQLIDVEDEGEILQYLSDDVQADFLGEMDAEEVLALTGGLEADDIADILQQLPDQLIREVLQSMDEHDRHRVEAVLPYAEDTAGGLMNTDVVTVRADITIDVVLRYLRRHESLPSVTDSLYVVSRRDEYIGVLPINSLLVADPSMTVREIMSTEREPITAGTSATEVANQFERHDWISAPVVDGQGRLIGRITIDDVVDVIREDAEHSLMSMAGLDEDEDTFAPVQRTAPRRAIWLGVNLLTAFLASAVIGLFEATIDKVVALAVLMPIVASMGGVAGTQTLTVVIRGMAIGHIDGSNSRWLISREALVGALNGFFWAIVVAGCTAAWFNDWVLGLIIACALVVNLITAGLAGAMLPMLLKRLHIDPALAGGVALTTVTDVVGFFAFLGLATVVYAS